MYMYVSICLCIYGRADRMCESLRPAAMQIAATSAAGLVAPFLLSLIIIAHSFQLQLPLQLQLQLCVYNQSAYARR